MTKNTTNRWSARAAAVLATAVGALAFAGAAPAFAASGGGCPVGNACEQLGECPPGMHRVMQAPAMGNAMQHMQKPAGMAGMMDECPCECDMAS